MHRKVIITGATGYIGSHVARHLLSQGWMVGVIVRQASSLDNIEDIANRLSIITYINLQHLILDFKDFGPDVVIHCAAWVNTHYQPQDVPAMIQSNITFGAEVLEAMKQCGCKSFVNTGTNWQNYNSQKYNPVDFYAATKEAFEKIMQYYVSAEDFKAITLRLYDVYGADDKRPKLWNSLWQHDTEDNTLNVSPGEQLLDMVYIDDICTAYETAIKELERQTFGTYKVYGVGTGKLYPLRQILHLYRQLTGKKLYINIGGKPYKAREVMIPARYDKLPGWQAKVSLREGMQRIVTTQVLGGGYK